MPASVRDTRSREQRIAEHGPPGRQLVAVRGGGRQRVAERLVPGGRLRCRRAHVVRAQQTAAERHDGAERQPAHEAAHEVMATHSRAPARVRRSQSARSCAPSHGVAGGEARPGAARRSALAQRLAWGRGRGSRPRGRRRSWAAADRARPTLWRRRRGTRSSRRACRAPVRRPGPPRVRGSLRHRSR